MILQKSNLIRKLEFSLPNNGWGRTDEGLMRVFIIDSDTMK